MDWKKIGSYFWYTVPSIQDKDIIIATYKNHKHHDKDLSLEHKHNMEEFVLISLPFSKVSPPV